MDLQSFIDMGQLGTAIWLCLRLERLLKHLTARVERVEKHVGLPTESEDAVSR